MELCHLVCLSQWRELIAIKRKIDKCGSPNHRLVNKVLDYSITEYKCYSRLVYDELVNRGVNVNYKLLREIFDWDCDLFKIKYKSLSDMQDHINIDHLYMGWHETKYLVQNLYNIEEKADCGIVTKEEWDKIYHKYYMYIDY